MKLRFKSYLAEENVNKIAYGAAHKPVNRELKFLFRLSEGGKKEREIESVRYWEWRSEEKTGDKSQASGRQQ